MQAFQTPFLLQERVSKNAYNNKFTHHEYLQMNHYLKMLLLTTAKRSYMIRITPNLFETIIKSLSDTVGNIISYLILHPQIQPRHYDPAQNQRWPYHNTPWK